MFCLSNRVIAVQSVKDLKIPLNHLADNVLFEQQGYRCTKRKRFENTFKSPCRQCSV